MWRSLRNKQVQRRLVYSLAFMGALASCLYVIASALRDNLVFFFSPTELHQRAHELPSTIRLGGMVVQGTLQHEPDQRVRFSVTDYAMTIPVVYQGILPDLFQEGQGVVAQGHYAAGVFKAQEILAKHDETYMPPEVARTLKKDHGQKSVIKDAPHAQ